MKNEKLLQAMGQIKEEFIEEAASMEKGKSSYRWVKWAALAACAALVIGIGAPKLFRTMNDEKRSFWPEEQEQDYAKNDTVTAETTENMDTSFTVGADEDFPDWGLTLSVKDVTPTGLTLVCSRRGGNPTGELECGTDYHLIVLEDGTWKDVPTVIEEYGWNSLAYWIPKGQDTEFTYSWEWLYGKLPAGTYRLKKGFMDFREPGDYDTAVYWVEFEIK